MKLKTKFQDEDFELGEVVDATIYTNNEIELVARPKSGGIITIRYKSLAELFEHWEDAPKEEPKNCWCISMYGGVVRVNEDDEPLIPDLKEIGNYFNDKDSTYDALEKLRAWKRLEDGGFKFIELRAPNWNARTDVITIKAKCPWNSTNIEDLGLLFSGVDE